MDLRRFKLEMAVILLSMRRNGQVNSGDRSVGAAGPAVLSELGTGQHVLIKRGAKISSQRFSLN